MQKLKGISSGQNNKSCRIIHHNPTKLVSHVSEFSVIFYAIYKKQQLTFTIGVALLQQGPWEDFCFRNVVPGRGAAAVPVKFRRILAGVRRGG
jgi:hypothetical protein